MDGDQLDALAKFIGSTVNRRHALIALVGGGAVTLSLTDPDETWSAKTGACKETCGPCEVCRKGRCKRKNGKKRCKPGVCEPRQDLDVCGVLEVRDPDTCGCCQTSGMCVPSSNVGCCSGSCTDVGGVFFCLDLIEGMS